MKIYLLSLFTVMLVGCSTAYDPPLGSANEPLTDVKDKPAPLFSRDDVSSDKMELRGGLWYVKGEAKPFTGKVTLWAPGHGNEIARQVVKTYVNGKEQGSKVHILIGKRAPRPNR
ncbi:MAG: hypothetical protein QF406_14670 [Verrucomicrobiota bacterium]|nr:hypothetical protein [Verrucomicrobiota bacterium]